MNILGIDTSSRNLAVCIASGDTVVWSEDYAEQFRHIEKLIPLVEKGCAKAAVALSDIDVVACGVGPGSFTGLRVGIAAGKALALAQKKKIIAFSSLDLIAHNIQDDADIIVLLDARREKLYSARYERRNGVLKKCKVDRLVSFAVLTSSIKRRKNKAVLVGDALKVYGAALKKECGKKVIFSSEEMWYPQAYNIAACVRERIEQKSFDSVSTLLPQYLRLTPAEEAHKKKRK